jgi:argininosuccinate lyase
LLLGFAGPTCNTYGSIATVDYLLERVAATGVLLAGFGRFVQDLLLWSTSEFSYVRFGDGFVQPSSIMPQKRNSVAIEHARAIGSKALGQTQAIVTSVHSTLFGDIVDTEDDLQPLVFFNVSRRDARCQARRASDRRASARAGPAAGGARG